MDTQAQGVPAAIASRLGRVLERGQYPLEADWALAAAIRFDSDWQGKNRDPQCETEVRLLWTSEELHLKFRCRYRSLTVFKDSEPNGRRDHLWDRDVAEVFLQADPGEIRHYREIEIAPNGTWIDLDVNSGQLSNLYSGMRSRVHIDETLRIWTAELALPMGALTEHFDPASEWRVNFFRVEGPQEPRFYSSWRPTSTAQPNFHVPEAFAPLHFAAEE